MLFWGIVFSNERCLGETCASRTKLEQVELMFYFIMAGFLEMCETISSSLKSPGKIKGQSGI